MSAFWMLVTVVLATAERQMLRPGRRRHSSSHSFRSDLAWIRSDAAWCDRVRAGCVGGWAVERRWAAKRPRRQGSQNLHGAFGRITRHSEKGLRRARADPW
jgi:hypothetical protein